MAIPPALVAFVQPWATLYSDNKAVSTSVMFVHLSGLLLGGGGAVAADRGTIRMSRAADTEQRAHLAALRAVHRIVLAGLAVTFVSGLLMLAGDIEAMLGAPAFWVKMGLVALLLANGGIMVRLEHPTGPAGTPHWGRLRAASVISLTLWFAIVLVSTILTATA